MDLSTLPSIENVYKPGGGHDGGFGMGGGLLGGLLFGLLLGNRNGGLFGNNQDPMAALALGQLSDIKSAVPLAAAQTEGAIARSENAITNQANQNLLATLNAIAGVKDAVTASTITNLQAELAEARTGFHSRGSEINVSQQVNQAQAQAQMQTQLAGLRDIVGGLAVQINRANQDIINLGSMTGSGVQTAVGRN